MVVRLEWVIYDVGMLQNPRRREARDVRPRMVESLRMGDGTAGCVWHEPRIMCERGRWRSQQTSWAARRSKSLIGCSNHRSKLPTLSQT